MASNTNPNVRFLLGASKAHDYRGRPEDAEAAGYAKKCACPNPHTYQDEDGERRCLCGRAV